MRLWPLYARMAARRRPPGGGDSRRTGLRPVDPGRWFGTDCGVTRGDGRPADYYRRVSGEHPDWDDYRVAALQRDQRVLLRIELISVGQAGKGGPMGRIMVRAGKPGGTGAWMLYPNSSVGIV
jgi:hypothetical protein